MWIILIHLNCPPLITIRIDRCLSRLITKRWYRIDTLSSEEEEMQNSQRRIQSKANQSSVKMRYKHRREEMNIWRRFWTNHRNVVKKSPHDLISIFSRFLPLKPTSRKNCKAYERLHKWDDVFSMILCIFNRWIDSTMKPIISMEVRFFLSNLLSIFIRSLFSNRIHDKLERYLFEKNDRREWNAETKKRRGYMRKTMSFAVLCPLSLHRWVVSSKQKNVTKMSEDVFDDHSLKRKIIVCELLTFHLSARNILALMGLFNNEKYLTCSRWSQRLSFYLQSSMNVLDHSFTRILWTPGWKMLLCTNAIEITSYSTNTYPVIWMS